jgi:hypothetical protein
MRKIIAVAAVAVALTACASAGAVASAAPAERSPVMYSGMGAWQNPARRPSSFILGAGFGISRTSWSVWNPTRAYGQGHLLACAGINGPCIRFRATVSLWNVRQHRGIRYFAYMKLTGKRQKTRWLAMRDGEWLQVAHPLITSGRT